MHERETECIGVCVLEKERKRGGGLDFKTRPPPTSPPRNAAVEQRGNSLKGFKDFYLKVKAKPGLDYLMCAIFDVPTVFPTPSRSRHALSLRSTPNPPSSNLNPQPSTLNPQPSTLSTPNPEQDLNLVINFDTPSHYEDYVHRVGRTGRAGNSGTHRVCRRLHSQVDG